MGGLFLARRDQCWQPKSVRGDQFFAEIGPGGPLLGETDFGVTGQGYVVAISLLLVN